MESSSDDLLDSVDYFVYRADSTPPENTFFHNSPNALYSFISDEVVQGGEFKFKLDFADRLNVGPRLQQILCVLYSRKETDATAKAYLKEIPSWRVDEALGREDSSCFAKYFS